MSAYSTEALLAPSFLADLRGLPLPEVRERRTAAQDVETSMSYLRRIIQGRLDIVVNELQRRAAGEEHGDLSDLVDRLPDILSDHVRAPGLGRMTSVEAPGVDQALLDELDRLLPPAELSRVPELSDDDLQALAIPVEEFEKRISGQRKALFDVIDRLQEEIVRRYRDGEASVETLLR